MGEFNVGFLKLCMHQLNQNLCLEFLTVNLYSITIQTKEVQEWGEVVQQRRRSEGEDGNGAVAVWEIIDSNNEMYLTIFKQLTV
jgi:hypothetical protein